MGLLDKILGRTKDTAREIGEHATPIAEKAGAAVGGAVDKATDFIDDKTGGRLTGALDKVDSATDRAVDAVDGSAGDAAEPAAPAGTVEAPAAAEEPAAE